MKALAGHSGPFASPLDPTPGGGRFGAPGAPFYGPGASIEGSTGWTPALWMPEGVQKRGFYRVPTLSINNKPNTLSD